MDDFPIQVTSVSRGEGLRTRILGHHNTTCAALLPRGLNLSTRDDSQPKAVKLNGAPHGWSSLEGSSCSMVFGWFLYVLDHHTGSLKFDGCWWVPIFRIRFAG